MATATLDWSASPVAENVDSYNVEQSVDSGATWTTLGNTSAVSFTTGALTPSVPYQWRIRAHNAVGFSEPSDPVDLPTVPSKPATPSVTVNP
jgi:hypothetical protein